MGKKTLSEKESAKFLYEAGYMDRSQYDTIMQRSDDTNDGWVGKALMFGLIGYVAGFISGAGL